MCGGFNKGRKALSVVRKKIKKTMGLYGVPIKVWKALGSVGIGWLTKVFNRIIDVGKDSEA